MEPDFAGVMQLVSQCTIEHGLAGDFQTSDLANSPMPAVLVCQRHSHGYKNP